MLVILSQLTLLIRSLVTPNCSLDVSQMNIACKKWCCLKSSSKNCTRLIISLCGKYPTQCIMSNPKQLDKFLLKLADNDTAIANN